MSKNILSVRITRWIRELLEEEARESGLSVSDVVRRKLRPYGQV